MCVWLLLASYCFTAACDSLMIATAEKIINIYIFISITGWFAAVVVVAVAVHVAVVVVAVVVVAVLVATVVIVVAFVVVLVAVVVHVVAVVVASVVAVVVVLVVAVVVAGSYCYNISMRVEDSPDETSSQVFYP